jgi:hypothetical protein
MSWSWFFLTEKNIENTILIILAAMHNGAVLQGVLLDKNGLFVVPLNGLSPTNTGLDKECFSPERQEPGQGQCGRRNESGRRGRGKFSYKSHERHCRGRA